jgi:hypothetical protein
MTSKQAKRVSILLYRPRQLGLTASHRDYLAKKIDWPQKQKENTAKGDKDICLPSRTWGYSLLGRVVGKVDALLDVALQARDRLLEQRLLLVGEVAEDVDCLLGAVGLNKQCQQN